MYENGVPFLKEWDIIMFCKKGSEIVLLFCIEKCDFDSRVRVFMEFVEDSSKHAKWKKYSDCITYDICIGRLICRRRTRICCV